MAKCERREIKPEPPPVEYVLTLTEDEIAYLERTIGRLVGPRDIGDDIYNAIADALGK